ERELGDDVNAKPGRGRRLDLGGKQAVDLGRGDARMALRIAGDADLADAAALRQPALDHLDRMMEAAGRRVAVAADHQEPRDACSAMRARKSSSASVLAKLRAATCGTGSKPRACRRLAVAICSSGGRVGTALT